MIQTICRQAVSAAKELRVLPAGTKNNILRAIAAALISEEEQLLAANLLDLDAGRESGLSEAYLDRLALTPSRIRGMADSLEVIAGFSDPIGEVAEGFKTENGLLIEKVRAPLGVVAVIYESRPNVTIDAAALCLKSSNVSILRGSSAAIHSNRALAELFCRVGGQHGLPDHAMQLVTDLSREAMLELIRQDQAIDVLIPRGGEGLKKYVHEHATIPLIMTGAGTCHIFVDESADRAKAIPLILNAKTQRPGTCNSVECLLLHRGILDWTAEIVQPLLQAGVKIHLTPAAAAALPPELAGQISITDDESLYGREFLALEILIKDVASVDEAIDHINTYGTRHSECILTENLRHADHFIEAVDAAVVYLNASTRFSDGGEFGFGGEIGISTQKLHARGPMGIRQLTSERFVVRGDGQIRA